MMDIQSSMELQQMAEMTEMLEEFTAFLTEAGSVLPGLMIGMLVAFILWRAILGLVARKVTANRGRKGGFCWGFFMGFIGIIVAAIRPKE